jgi:predicted nucleic acid-binding protein
VSNRPPSAPRATRSSHVVVDASVVLAFYLPAEPLKRHALALLQATVGGRTTLGVPTLAWYEILNALARAARGLKAAPGMTKQQAIQVVDAIAGLRLQEHPISGLEPRILEITLRHQRTAYDAAYIAIAENLGVDLLTGDLAFYRGIRASFPRVRFLGDYPVRGA